MISTMGHASTRTGRWISVLVLMTLVAAPGIEGGIAAKRRKKGPETADWVPFRGNLQVSRTWRHAGGHGFPSVDFDLPTGGSIRVRAAGPGTVLAVVDDCPDIPRSGAGSDCNGGEGNFLEIVHPDGRRSRYLHLRKGSAVVSPGDHVCRGCPIARSGWSGAVMPPGPAGAHIHYEEIRQYRTVAPGPMFARHGRTRVRYPGKGGWRSAGSRQIRVRNTGFPTRTPAPRGSCDGFAATIAGTSNGEEIAGTSGPDIIFGGGGDDTIRGRDGEDRICGGDGNDLLVGGSGNDVLDGGAGFDVCHQGETTGAEPGHGGTAANCERPPFILTVQPSAGWMVESDPAGIACPGDCTEPYEEGTEVRLQATGVGSPSWSGCDTVSFSVCTITMWFDRTVRV